MADTINPTTSANTPVISPTVLSSQGGANAVQKADQQITDLEKSITIPSGATLSGLASQYGTTITDLMKANPNIVNPNLIYAGGKLNIPVSSPIAQKMVGDINQAISGGNLTADQQAGLDALHKTGDAVITATNNARAAQNAGDYNSMDTFIQQAQDAKTKMEKDLADYYQQIAPLRQKAADLMSPTAREGELNRQLLDIRNQEDQIKLANDRAKWENFQGQAGNIALSQNQRRDMETNFRLQEMALEEKNVLLSLGLEQNARTQEQKSIQQQIDDFANDYKMRTEVQTEINKINQSVIDRADKLQADAKSTLTSIMDKFKGMNFDDLSSDSKKQLENLAGRSGLDINLIKDALKAQKAQQVFENAVKGANVKNPAALTTFTGGNIVAGQKVDPAVSADAEDVLMGRNTLYNIRQTMGRTNTAATYMQSLRQAIRAVDPNFDFIASDAGGKFASTEFYNKSIAAINNAIPDIKIVSDLSDQVSRLGVKVVDKLLQSGATQIGNQKVTSFHQAQKLLADSIGIALGQGAVSDMKLQLGFDITDPSITAENFAANMKLVSQFIENRKMALEGQRYKSSTSGGIGSNANTISVGGQSYNIGQLYQDSSGSQWSVDANGNWTKH